MISIIVAISDNGVIGDKNSLLWHISEDMRYFRMLTTHHKCIMGRKTYESIGRPLPNRENIVISTKDISIEGCHVVHSIQEAIGCIKEDEEAFILGGAMIYNSILPLADKLYITHVHHPYEGDTRFNVDLTEWEEVFREDFPRGEKFEYPFSMVQYEKKRK